MSNLSVRQAVLADLDDIVPLFDGYRQFYGCSSDIKAAREFLISRFNHSESVLFIACVDGVAAGFTQLYPSFSSVSLARTFVLNDLFVHEQFHRQGVAKSLISAATHYAKTLGAIRLTLSTAGNNEKAQGLYKSLGWARDEQFLVYHFSIRA
jgi:ribosomal protein S18 acetylase RimI-like enzyme